MTIKASVLISRWHAENDKYKLLDAEWGRASVSPDCDHDAYSLALTAINHERGLIAAELRDRGYKLDTRNQVWINPAW